MIDGDIDKKKRGKFKTNRYPITPLFVEATQEMNNILDLMKQIKIISISELKRARTY